MLGDEWGAVKMGYKEKASREQIMLLPDSIDEYVGEDNPVRVIDGSDNQRVSWQSDELDQHLSVYEDEGTIVL